MNGQSCWLGTHTNLITRVKSAVKLSSQRGESLRTASEEFTIAQQSTQAPRFLSKFCSRKGSWEKRLRVTFPCPWSTPPMNHATHQKARHPLQASERLGHLATHLHLLCRPRQQVEAVSEGARQKRALRRLETAPGWVLFSPLSMASPFLTPVRPQLLLVGFHLLRALFVWLTDPELITIILPQQHTIVLFTNMKSHIRCASVPLLTLLKFTKIK